MRKFYLLLIVLMLVGQTDAKNYFRNGMKWVYASHGSYPFENPTYVTLELDGDTVIGDMRALKLWEVKIGEDVTRRSLQSVIRTEGDKVYYLSVWNTQNWSLLYDFNPETDCKFQIVNPYQNLEDAMLKYQAGSDMFEIWRTGNIEYNSMYGCDAIPLKMTRFGNANDNLADRGYWLDGIGSYAGVMQPTLCFDGVGGWYVTLMEATLDGEVLAFNRNLSGIKDTVLSEWRVYTTSDGLLVTGLEKGDCISVYTVDGKRITQYIAQSDMERIRTGNLDLCIVRINHRSVIIKSK